MKPIDESILNSLFNENKNEILLNYVRKISNKKNINAFATLFKYAIIKNNKIILDSMFASTVI